MLLTKGKQRGYEIITDPAHAQPEEHDTFTCGHCGTVERERAPIMRGNVRDNSGALAGLCNCCGKLICLKCVGKGCVPLERQIEAWERRKEYDECSKA